MGVPLTFSLATVALALVAVCATPGVASAAGFDDGVAVLEPLELPSHAYSTMPVQQWGVDDVAAWMNHTLGYAEYARFVLKHRIDGPTLLYITPADIEEHFPLSNAIHIVKLRAHLDLLRGKCLCPTSGATDLWSFLEARRDIAFTRGAALAYMPRLGLFFTYLFDAKGTAAVLGTPLDPEQLSGGSSTSETSAAVAEADVSWGSTILFFAGSLFFPNLYIAFQLMRFWLGNYFALTPVILYFLMCQYNEIVHGYHLYMAYRAGEALRPPLVLLAFHYSMAIPVAVWLLSFVLPFVALQVLFFVFLAHCTFIMVGTGVMAFHVLFAPKDSDAHGSHDARAKNE